jgi:hypothetical protein
VFRSPHQEIRSRFSTTTCVHLISEFRLELATMLATGRWTPRGRRLPIKVLG